MASSDRQNRDNSPARFLGGPSTGKSVLAVEMGKKLNEPVCAEFGRNYWFAHQRNHRLSMNDLEIIAQNQALEEDKITKCTQNIVIADTSPLTTLCYAYYYFGSASERLMRIADDYHKRKRILVVCDTDIPFDDTPDRSGPGSREELQNILKMELDKRGLDFFTVSGTVEQRCQKGEKIISNWRIVC